MRRGGWPREAGHELHGSTLGVIGYGPSGRAVAQIGVALGMDVPVATSHPEPDPNRPAVRFAELDTVIRGADYLCLHTRADPASPPLIDARRLQAMKPTAALINTARGSLVDGEALVAALREGTIAAAALEVLEREPPGEGNPMLQQENLLITSHLAGQTVEARARAGRVAAQAVVDVLAGREPAHPVDR